MFCSPILVPTLSYAPICEVEGVDFGAKVQFVFEVDVSRVKVLHSTDRNYYLAREHHLTLSMLHVVVRGACPSHFKRGHIAHEAYRVIKVPIPLLERTDVVFPFQNTWLKRSRDSVPMIDRPASSVERMVPVINTGTLGFIQPVLTHPAGPSFNIRF